MNTFEYKNNYNGLYEKCISWMLKNNIRICTVNKEPVWAGIDKSVGKEPYWQQFRRRFDLECFDINVWKLEVRDRVIERIKNLKCGTIPRLTPQLYWIGFDDGYYDFSPESHGFYKVDWRLNPSIVPVYVVKGNFAPKLPERVLLHYETHVGREYVQAQIESDRKLFWNDGCGGSFQVVFGEGNSGKSFFDHILSMIWGEYRFWLTNYFSTERLLNSLHRREAVGVNFERIPTDKKVLNVLKKIIRGKICNSRGQNISIRIETNDNLYIKDDLYELLDKGHFFEYKAPNRSDECRRRFQYTYQGHIYNSRAESVEVALEEAIDYLILITDVECKYLGLPDRYKIEACPLRYGYVTRASSYSFTNN